ncbi:germ cell nuclear acidic protein-like [Babylonia areolata]|uniref:germ cell nuclear acidic protein-like n=1 Tax=Babylonia areolata TaxID=304850 RepID=UPI003FD502A5
MRPLSFLKSLSITTPDHLRDQEARSYITNFKRRQEELSSRLFQLFNFTVFENQLPADLPVVWNKRLLKTAGLCKQKRVNDRYTASIELSTKVCDSAERVRDTLVHEMCHAAVWILNKAKEGHGPHWKYWARKANRAHPEIPIIRRCHDYRINTKFIYRCVDCGYQIGRHSKSLDTERKVCGHCHGRFQLLTSGSRCGSAAASVSATPRTPNPFALFVKENYGSVKRDGGGLPHKEVMEALSKQFAKTKINFS